MAAPVEHGRSEGGSSAAIAVAWALIAVAFVVMGVRGDSPFPWVVVGAAALAATVYGRRAREAAVTRRR